MTRLEAQIRKHYPTPLILLQAREASLTTHCCRYATGRPVRHKVSRPKCRTPNVACGGTVVGRETSTCLICGGLAPAQATASVTTSRCLRALGRVLARRRDHHPPAQSGAQAASWPASAKALPCDPRSAASRYASSCSCLTHPQSSGSPITSASPRSHRRCYRRARRPGWRSGSTRRPRPWTGRRWSSRQARVGLGIDLLDRQSRDGAAGATAWRLGRCAFERRTQCFRAANRRAGGTSGG